MENQETYYIAKNKYSGWQAKKRVNIDNLQVSTTIEKFEKEGQKYIVAFVCVGKINNNFVKHEIFKDYHKRFKVLDNVKTVTSKLIEKAIEIYEKESANLILEEIKNFYLVKN